MFIAHVRKKGLEGSFKFPWKVSIVAFMANPKLFKAEEVGETVRFLASDPFFDMLEINNLPDEAWREVEEALASTRRVEVALGLQPMVLIEKKDPCALDEKARAEAVAELKRWIDIAARRGIDKVAFCSGPDPGPENREAAKDALIKSLKEVVAYAKERDVFVILETFDRDHDKRLLIGPIDEAVEVAREVREEYDNFGLMWDLSHAPMLNEKPSDLARAKEYLAHIHVGCTKKLPDGSLKDWHPGFYRPGALNGVEEVKELIKALLDIGYKGAVGFEVKPEEGQDWREVVQAAKGVLYTAYCKFLEEVLG